MLRKLGMVHAVLTDDSDLLPYVYNSLSHWPGCAGGELVVSDGDAL